MIEKEIAYIITEFTIYATAILLTIAAVQVVWHKLKNSKKPKKNSYLAS